jgi:hypothetical protein
MGYRGIRSIGVISGIMALLVLGHGFWAAFVPDSRSADLLPAPGQAVWLAFLLLGLLAIRVGGMLEVQALEIAALKRRLAEQRQGGA